MSVVSERVTRAWQRGVGPAASRVLGIAAEGYRGLIDAREWLYARGVLRSRVLGVPVVSVGNLTVGGTGKTPAVELAVRMLMDLGHRRQHAAGAGREALVPALHDSAARAHASAFG